MNEAPPRPLHHSLAPALAAAALGAPAVAATGLAWGNALPAGASPPALALVALALLVGERVTSTWIRFGPLGTVTPRSSLAFALLLLGSPPLAVAAAVLGAAIRAEGGRPADRFARVARAALALTGASFVMFALGVDAPITAPDPIPTTWALAIIAGAATILAVNAAATAFALIRRRAMPLRELDWRALAPRASAEAALLSLATIWVIGVDYSPVLLPVLGLTSMLVFRSARQSLEHAHEINHDPLTGLANRRNFLARLDETFATTGGGPGSAVLIMDLDGFKDINDRLGHQVGDALLIAFAERLERSLPPGSLAARLGGDEFGVLVRMDARATEDPETVLSAVSELHGRLTGPLPVEGFPVTVGVSIGIARAGIDGTTTRDLLRAADVAMYRAKRHDAAFELHEPGIRAPQPGQLNLLGELGDALDHHQLHIDYQPLLRIADGSIDGVEALVRWQHPEHGTIPPSEFIGLAEHTDLIGPLTELVLRDATSGMGELGVKLAVNVSARSLHDRHFASQVLGILGQTGFPATGLELEVSERAIIAHPDRSTYTIERLREAGVGVTIDDFGVGHSSYQTLRSIQVDRVKIDRDFVRGVLTHPRDRKIVSSLIDLAHDLDVVVVAEGVESPQVWDSLAALGCDVAQGYGIAVPMPLARFCAWLENWDRVLDGEPRPTRTR